MILTGQVFRVHTDRFFVKNADGEFRCSARAGLKRRGGILVGDFVKFNQSVIEGVLPRKNRFYRPAVSNVDTLVIVLSESPKPDFLLIDKLVINAICRDLSIVFVINKCDLLQDLYDTIVKEYSYCNAKILKVSTNNAQGLDELKELINGKLALLAGQSAVGKTSIINALFNLELKTGGLSEKIERGKHTTTHSEIYYGDNLKVIDTPGFAVIDSDVTIEELPDCYPEYFKASESCKFRGCSHTSEPDCMVKRLVESGELSQARYQRYIEIYKELKEKRSMYEKY